MKAKLFYSLLLTSFLLSGCGIFDNLKSGSISSNDDKSSQSYSESSQEEIEQISLEPNTPQSWIDLFTFDNVTILFRYNLSILTDHDFKCVDGIWYCKDEGYDEFFPHDGRNIFDLYLSNYSKFTYYEESNSYKTEQWKADDSGYLKDVTIELDENNRISFILDDAILNSSELVCSLSFIDYGVTTLS